MEFKGWILLIRVQEASCHLLLTNRSRKMDVWSRGIGDLSLCTLQGIDIGAVDTKSHDKSAT